jgi:hypothetical protein
MNLSEIKGISNTINYKNSIAEISDEEIEKESNRYLGEENRFCFKSGAKWYREQIKTKI